MSMISAQTMIQAREALMTLASEKITLQGQLKEQAKKIADLEREVQKQASAAAEAREALTDAKREIEALRAQMPDDATIRAHESLVDYLTAPSEEHPLLRIAA